MKILKRIIKRVRTEQSEAKKVLKFKAKTSGVRKRTQKKSDPKHEKKRVKRAA